MAKTTFNSNCDKFMNTVKFITFWRISHYLQGNGG